MRRSRVVHAALDGVGYGDILSGWHEFLAFVISMQRTRRVGDAGVVLGGEFAGWGVCLVRTAFRRNVRACGNIYVRCSHDFVTAASTLHGGLRRTQANLAPLVRRPTEGDARAPIRTADSLARRMTRGHARAYSGGMSLLDRIVVDPDVVHGRPAIRGTRVRVADVLSLLAAGASESEILEDYPYLAVEDIRASLEYAAAQANHAILIAS